MYKSFKLAILFIKSVIVQKLFIVKFFSALYLQNSLAISMVLHVLFGIIKLIYPFY
jgi:hypothetical protein